MRTINTLALILLIIGGLNWLLVGLFGFDLVASLFAAGFGTRSLLSNIVYVLVGLSGLWALFALLPRVVSSERYDYGQVEAT